MICHFQPLGGEKNPITWMNSLSSTLVSWHVTLNVSAILLTLLSAWNLSFHSRPPEGSSWSFLWSSRAICVMLSTRNSTRTAVCVIMASAVACCERLPWNEHPCDQERELAGRPCAPLPCALPLSSYTATHISQGLDSCSNRKTLEYLFHN